MSFLSSVKRVVGAVSTGGLSLLAPKSVQETIGNVSLGAQAVGALGAGAGVLAAGGTIGSALGAGGSSAFNIGTAGSQLVAGGLGSLLNKVGIGGGGSLPEQLSGPPDAGSSPPNSFLSAVGNFAPMARKALPALLPSGATRVSPGQMLTAGLTTGGPMDITGGLPGGMYSDMLPGAQISGGMVQTAGTVGRVVGQLVLGAGNVVKGVIDKAGRFVRSGKVAELAEKYGLEVAAAGLGVGLGEIAMTLVSHHSRKRKRRHRGISARDMRTTGRTVTKIVRMNEKLRHLCAAGHFTRRAAARPRTVQVIGPHRDLH